MRLYPNVLPATLALRRTGLVRCRSNCPCFSLLTSHFSLLTACRSLLTVCPCAFHHNLHHTRSPKRVCPSWTINDHVRQLNSNYSSMSAPARICARRNRQCRRTLRPTDAVLGPYGGFDMVKFDVSSDLCHKVHVPHTSAQARLVHPREPRLHCPAIAAALVQPVYAATYATVAAYYKPPG